MITLIVARAANNVIGLDGKMPWRIPADLRHFKALTTGRPMIMGRKTFESLPGLLSDRRHIVLTRDTGWSAPGAEIAHDVGAALALAGTDVSIIGGAEIYRLFIPLADRIELTEIHAAPNGDTHLPDFGPEWVETAREACGTHDFVTLEK
ncbi:dihydrofolate reductase [Sphingomonas sp.]|uniref:dihydrofolate reductase n=1 Tax=Sphingomonas sp. TaxID=28214 RepID=UPI0025D831DC|nr:dihydrofolate reductase [Sphingomonas sp.]